ncbi:conserved protein of unknown function [Rhodovastum atsumiense]|uniref:Uncharacterized protein n=1 Tax=Rhodovastum atsumiense TaxID=504468 RepID=A0A5M6IJN0_9PROT|nr:hypothetical protein [Rhodovastum atsumiense]KAA5608474.1 hypothetical protein F1189_28965 [Rhodovastum atsumiense]CAH2599667.1 conserved protein of unknown function [Rhodovastum atsumiense]
MANGLPMGALKVAVVAMGVLIVAGVLTIAVVIAGRMSQMPAATSAVVLDEPAGTRIVGVSALPDRLALQLQGGGPDRVVMVDIRTGRVVARAALAH